MDSLCRAGNVLGKSYSDLGINGQGFGSNLKENRWTMERLRGRKVEKMGRERGDVCTKTSSTAAAS